MVTHKSLVVAPGAPDALTANLLALGFTFSIRHAQPDAGTRRMFALPTRASFAISVLAGVMIAAIDAFASRGEISPIVIVLLLLASTSFLGVFVSTGSATCGFAIAAPLPLSHALRHALHMPDTLQPNTYDSIFLLALFTLAVSFVGLLLGHLIAGRVTPHKRL